MYLYRTFKSALMSLAANKLRSMLAVLGIVIGVSAVIMMLGMGRGAEKKASSSIATLGVNLLFVYPGQQASGHSWARTGQAETLTVEDSSSLAQIPHVVSVAPDVFRFLLAKQANKHIHARITGTAPEYQTVRNYACARGRFFTKQEVTGLRRVCVLGSKIASDLFGARDPVGQWIKIDRKNFKVVGVMEEKGGQGSWINLDEWIYVPITTAMNRLWKRRWLNQIIVSIDDLKNTDEVTQGIQKILLQRHKISPTEEPDFTIGSQTEIRQRMTEMTGAFTILLSGIAVVSLLVGGIGIMNIMLVSVTERTREIGIRRAVGARQIDIVKQFLIESVTISLLGGALGILVGILGAQLIPRLPVWEKLSSGQWESVVSADSILLSFLFSCAVGVFFGIYPAIKAAHLNPVEALRYE